MYKLCKNVLFQLGLEMPNIDFQPLYAIFKFYNNVLHNIRV